MSRYSVPWLRLLADGTAIVLSILLAFGIDAWWGDVQQDRRAGEALSELTSALEESLRDIDRLAELTSTSRSQVQHFLAATPAELSQLGPDETNPLLTAIVRPLTSDLNVRSLTATLEQEALRGVEDSRFGYWTRRWRGATADLDERRVALDSGSREALRALGRHPAAGASLNEVSGAALAAMREDPNIIGLAILKASTLRVQMETLGSLREATDSLLHVTNRLGMD